MKNIIYKSLLFSSLAGLVISCKPNFKDPKVDKGSVDASRYVALGNSITAGYADGALYYEGQQNSYANILAEQLKLIGGGEFKIPYLPAASIGVGGDGGAPFKLDYSTDCLGVTSLGPVRTATVGDLSVFSSNIYASAGPFNLMGVPGAKAITAIFPGYGNPALGTGNYNPFFTRIASNPATASMLSDAEAQNPTFFTLFLGNNDVLAYALAGGASDFITPTANFNAAIDTLVEHLTKNGAKGVIANIPDVTSIPHFNTIPYNALALTQPLADQLNGLYGPLGVGISFHVGNNAFVIKDASAALGFRQIKSNELLVLTTPLDSIKCHNYGSLVPIPDKYVLTETEIANIQSAVAVFNSKLKAVADAKGLAFVDVNAFMANAKDGIVYNGIDINAQFVKGGAFSLDGIHLTPLGNALLANEFIKSINAKYGSSIPQVDASKYRGVKFPN